jgi:DnaJ family protein A protein 2
MSQDEETCYYALLGVARDVSAEELKKAYKKQCVKHHPDKGGDENMFKQVSEAYTVLKDPEKRHLYDTFGKKAVNGHDASHAQHHDMSAVFGAMFGGGSPHRPQPSPRVLRIPLEDVFRGCPEYTYTYTRHKRDDRVTPEACPVCRGHGVRDVQSQMGFMSVQQRVMCPSCRGKKYQNAESLFHTVTEKIRLPIPRDIKNNHMFVVQGMGHQQFDGSFEDLIVVVQYEDHPLFRVIDEGPHMYAAVPLTLNEALHGFHKTLTHLDGEPIVLNIDQPVRWGHVIVVEHRGLYQSAEHGRGHLYVGFDVTYPSPPHPTLRMKSVDVVAGLSSQRHSPRGPHPSPHAHGGHAHGPHPSPHAHGGPPQECAQQ